ncbi:MAG: DUF4091 domain-containing protein [Planctomycetes bacterium]|nr:DUF4091 domain-containing protein [Planctomycetota bacterium]
MIRFLLAALVAAWAAHSVRAEVSFWPESSGEMILPDRVKGSEERIVRSGVRGEFVTAQLALRVDAIPQADLSLEWTALKGPGGTELAKEHLAFYRAAEIVVDHGTQVDEAKDPHRVRKLGAFPDALVPLKLADGTNVANAVRPEPQKTIAFWLDLYIPADTKPGAYSGRVELREGDKALVAVPIVLTVLDAAIPADSTIPSLYNLRAHPHVKANIDAYAREMQRHRIQATSYHYLALAGRADFGLEFLDRFNPDGKGWVSVYVPDAVKPTPDREKELADQLKRIAAHLKEKKLFEKSFVYLKDEPDESAIQGALETAKIVLREVTEWKGKLLCTLNRDGSVLEEVLTHYSRALKVYGPWYAQNKLPRGREEWDRARAEGKELWFYVSNAQGWPYFTFDIQTVKTAWEPRVMGWAWWYEKAYGHLYWDLMYVNGWKSHPKFPPGDGQLIYPGDLSMPGAPEFSSIKDLKMPVVSRRLKLLREGLEEWELLKLAEAKAGRAKVQAIVDKVYTAMGRRTWAPEAYDPKKPMWSYEEAAWDRAREEIIALIQAK